jgi:hypothetical protein
VTSASRSLTLLPDLAREAWWKLRGGDASPRERTWPIPPADLEGVVIGWPAAHSDPHTARFVEFLVWAFRRRVGWETRPIPQPWPLTVVFELEVRGARYRHAIDVADLDPVNPETAGRSDLVFKLQFAGGGYPWPNVLPGGYVPKGPDLYAYLPHLRRLRDGARTRHEVYGRFSPRVGTGVRSRAARLLADQEAFRYTGGLAKVRYLRSLEEAARSRVCLDLPGNGAFCYRLVENLAIGSCIVGPAPRNRLPIPLEDGVHMAFCRPDLSDLVERCAHYLEHPEERLRLVRGSRDYFDRTLHREQIGDYYLRCCLEHHRQAGRGNA